MPVITADRLGHAGFRKKYGLRYAYVAGAMYKGIASKALVIAMSRAGLMSYFGTGGVPPERVERVIGELRENLSDGQPYGMNLLSDPEDRSREGHLVDLFLKHGIRNVEAAAYVTMSDALVRFRLAGIGRDAAGRLHVPNRVLAKVSRPEVAEAFMSPPPESIVSRLVESGALSATQAALARHVPMAHEVCVESDSGGHTDQGVAFALVPAILALREEMMRRYRYEDPIYVGAAGGIGTPEAAASAFILGADFVLTGSINQCTVEAGTSDAVKDLLQDINVQDTAHAPSGDLFELGAKVQVLRRGVFFPARAQKLYELYQRHDRLEDIDPAVRRQIEQTYFRRSFEEVWEETRRYYSRIDPVKLAQLERNPKRRMALLFRWYFVHSSRLALQGSAEQKVDYQVHCGPALGAFNQWVRDSELRSWRRRHVADLGLRIMDAAADVLNRRIRQMACDAP